MRKKTIPIWVYVLIVACVCLLGVGQAVAQIDLKDQSCTSEEIAQHLCFNVSNGDSQVDYVVQIKPADELWPDEPKDRKWPIDHTEASDPYKGLREFRYKAFVPTGTDCKGVPTWNYFVQKLSGCGGMVDYVVSSSPPGAQLLLPGNTIPKCTQITAQGNEALLKWNPALNCSPGNSVTFSIFTSIAANVPTSFCNLSVVTTKLGCEGGYLLGPGCSFVPLESTRIFSVGPAGAETIKVDFDRCSGAATSVTAGDGTPLPKLDAFICNKNSNGTLTCYKISNAGPRSSGCVIDANPTYYLYGGDAYRR